MTLDNLSKNVTTTMYHPLSKHRYTTKSRLPIRVTEL